MDISRLVWGALMPGLITPEVEPWLARGLAEGISAVCLFHGASGSPERTRTTVQRLRALAPHVMIAVDEEGGEVTRLQESAGSSFLSAAALGVIDDVEVTRATGRLIGRMLRRADVDWALAPVADVTGIRGNSAIGARSFSSSASAAATHVEAFVTGMQSMGVVASAKHFPGHGTTRVDSHESVPLASATREELRQRDLVPFAAAIGAGVGSVMTGHLLLPALDREAPASLSRVITTGLLREELGFEGVVITDAIDMTSVSGPAAEYLPQAVVSALQAGADIVCLGARDQERAAESAARAIFNALAEGALQPAELVAAGERRSRLSAWRRRMVADDSAARDEELVAAAAVDSLVVRGDAGLTGDTVDVLRFSSWRGYVSGTSTWGVGAHLTALGLDVDYVDRAPAGSERDLVIEVRDVETSGDLHRLLVDAVRARPDAVIVDVGTPASTLPPCRGSITTHGVGNLSSGVAACVLAGREPRPVALAILKEVHLAETVNVAGFGATSLHPVDRGASD